MKSSNAKDEENTEQLNGRITGWLLISILAASFGSSFVYGYNVGVINVAGNTIQRWIAESQQFIPMNTTSGDPFGKTLSDKVFLDSLNENDKAKITFVWSLVGGIFPLGAMFGGLMSGAIADKFGRKGGMLLNNLLTFAAGLILFCTKWSGSYYILWLGRFLIGINSGLNSSLAPMYLTEIAPVNYRGLLGSVSQLVGTVAILIANILGFEFLLGTETLWPYLLGFTIVPAIWQLATLPLCPESPKYLLISKGQHDHARNALVKLRQTSDVQAEINVMQEEADKIKSSPKVTLKDMFTQKLLRWALFIAVMMMLSQQFSGINATMFYSTIIFEKDAKLSLDNARWATVGIMVVNVLMTLVSTAIVDKAGRRTLHLTGLGGMCLSTVLLVVALDLSGKDHNWAAYASILFVTTFIISFATGPGSIPWFYVSECFEQGARANANSVAVGVNWFATFLIGLCFPPVQKALKQFTFLIFTGFLIFFWLFTYKFIPETKNKSVERVLAEMKKQIGEDSSTS